jgi:glycosyltransferase involved in cell wall biosynthesis
VTTKRVLWVSTSMQTRGGVATYVRTMRKTPLWDSWNIRHVATHRNGSVARRVLAFGRGTLMFVCELVLRRPAVIHLHTSTHGSFARKSLLAWISRAAGVPFVIHVHGGGFKEFYSDAPRLLQRYIRATFEGADALIALGETWADALHHIAPRARIAVVSNAVVPHSAVAQPGPGEPVQVLFLGDVEDHKGAFLLLDAWRRLADDVPVDSADLVVAGSGSVDRARQTVRELGIADHVEVTGWVAPAQVEELLSTSHVLVLPSTFEGQPMAVLEAMAHGLCVVATDVGGIPDLVADCGVLVPVGDLSALVDALRHVLVDAEDRAELGARALRRVKEEFDANQTWKRLDSLYQELVG